MVWVGKQTNCLVLVHGLSPVRIAELKITCITYINRRCGRWILCASGVKPLKFSWSIDRFSLTFTVDRNGRHYLSLVRDYLLFCVYYLRFRWYATLGNKTPAETFPKFPSVLRVIDRSDRNPPITATSVTFRPSYVTASELWLVDFDPICR